MCLVATACGPPKLHAQTHLIPPTDVRQARWLQLQQLTGSPPPADGPVWRDYLSETQTALSGRSFRKKTKQNKKTKTLVQNRTIQINAQATMADTRWIYPIIQWNYIRSHSGRSESLVGLFEARWNMKIRVTNTSKLVMECADLSRISTIMGASRFYSAVTKIHVLFCVKTPSPFIQGLPVSFPHYSSNASC